MDRIKAHFVGQFKRSELGMVSEGAFLQSKSLQSIYLVVTGTVGRIVCPLVTGGDKTPPLQSGTAGLSEFG
jgi:hypothetical protein